MLIHSGLYPSNSTVYRLWHQVSCTCLCFSRVSDRPAVIR
nr:MAG TPA: hypothetical protein [Caudoviricetes sp.]